MVGELDELAPWFSIGNSHASGRKKRPRGPRSIPTVVLTSGQDTFLQRPLVDRKTQATVYYLHYHLQTLKDAPNVTKSVSDDFQPPWISTAECLILDLAVSSMALAVFSQTQHHPPAAVEAPRKYHRLLQIAPITISTLDERNIDACLLATSFVSRYEDVVHRLVNPV